MNFVIFTETLSWLKEPDRTLYDLAGNFVVVESVRQDAFVRQKGLT